MKVLAIDGALGAFSAAVAVDGTVMAHGRRTGNVALEEGLPAIAQVLAAAGLSPQQLDRIAVIVGPGGFTGLRIAVAFAKSLAQAWQHPLVAVSSFDALEFGTDFDPALTVVSGRPGVISARFRQGTAQRRASGRVAEVLDGVLPAHLSELATVGAPEDVLAALAERGIVVRSFDPRANPPAAAAALLAAGGDAAPSVHEVRADYGELPAAKIPKHLST